MGGRKGAWALSCFVLDTELQVQPQTWVLSAEMGQGMCWGTGGAGRAGAPPGSCWPRRS